MIPWDERQAYLRQAMDTSRALSRSCDHAQVGEPFSSEVLEQLDLMVTAARAYDEAVAVHERG